MNTLLPSEQVPPAFLPAPIPANETERIAALRAIDILDTAEEDIYNSITQAAADVCQTPMASLTFIDEKRQWFKARVGLKDRETAREPAFCAHAINGPEMLLIPDTERDDRFRNNPFVTGDPHLRFYAGMPLSTLSGFAVGTLCVLDNVPRTLTDEQKKSLTALAGSAMRVLALRKNLGLTVFAKAVDMTSDGVTISDTADNGGLRTMYANESFLIMAGVSYVEAIDRSPLFPLGDSCPVAQEACDEAVKQGQMKTVECRFQRRDHQFCWSRVSFVPYVDQGNRLVYVVTAYRDITAIKESELQSQQFYAMKTTLATIAHVVKNFLNSAQLYSSQAQTGSPVPPTTQAAFTSALESTRAQLAALDRMAAFKDRPTPFGFSVLDPEK